MRTDLLLEQFDTLVRTPEDVAGLEAAILGLAVRGHLVPQDPDDEAATKLLKRIKSDMKRFRPIGSDEIPYELPGNWAWTRLGEVFELEYGKSMPKKDRDSDGDVPVYGSNGVIGHHSEALVGTPCIVVGRKGSSGAVNLARQPCWVIDTAFFVRPPDGIDLAFSYHLLRSLGLEFLGKGIKPGLNRNEAYRLPIGIPPLAEQKRIVARVDELLAQTRALAAQLQAADEALVPAAQASFQALTGAPDAAQQSEAWQRISSAFDALTADPRIIDALKQTVLQLAVQGKLVPQDPSDEPAADLLRRIRTDKRHFIRNNEFRKEKPIDPLEDGEIPHQVPGSWVWSKVGEATYVTRGASPRPKGDPRYFSETRTPYHWVKISDIRKHARGNILTDTSEFLTEAGMRKSKYLEKGTLILTNSATIGVPIFLGVSGCIHDGYLAFPFSGGEGIVAQYLYYYFLGIRRLFVDRARGLAQLNLNSTIVRNLPFPLPPLAEQERIVAKVESLLALCDKLAAEVVAAEEVRGRLLAAVLNGE